jgi:hypothetical protein
MFCRCACTPLLSFFNCSNRPASPRLLPPPPSSFPLRRHGLRGPAEFAAVFICIPKEDKKRTDSVVMLGSEALAGKAGQVRKGGGVERKG